MCHLAALGACIAGRLRRTLDECSQRVAFTLGCFEVAIVPEWRTLWTPPTSRKRIKTRVVILHTNDPMDI